MRPKPCWIFLFNIGADGWVVATQRIGGDHSIHRNVTRASRERLVNLVRTMTSIEWPIRPVNNGWCWQGSEVTDANSI